MATEQFSRWFLRINIVVAPLVTLLYFTSDQLISAGVWALCTILTAAGLYAWRRIDARRAARIASDHGR